MKSNKSSSAEDLVYSHNYGIYEDTKVELKKGKSVLCFLMSDCHIFLALYYLPQFLYTYVLKMDTSLSIILSL
jgi:hypothetical protein